MSRPGSRRRDGTATDAGREVRDAIDAQEAIAAAFVIYGSPRTKKNHSAIHVYGGRRKVVPSAAWMHWRDVALLQIPGGLRLPDRPYNCRALFYRDRATGDATGYYQALADVLEEAGVVSNDRLLVSWDGSRLLKDAKRPRVEVLLTPLADQAAA